MVARRCSGRLQNLDRERTSETRPRRMRRTPLFTSIILIIAIPALIWVALQDQTKINSLQSIARDGNLIQARITSLERHRRSRSPASYRVHYDFSVGKGDYFGDAQIDSKEFSTLKVDDRIPVTYLRTNPQMSTWKPSAQIKTRRLEQLLAVLCSVGLAVWLVMEIRRGFADGWLARGTF